MRSVASEKIKMGKKRAELFCTDIFYQRLIWSQSEGGVVLFGVILLKIDLDSSSEREIWHQRKEKCRIVFPGMNSREICGSGEN